MDPRFSQRYRDLYERHWWFRVREELIVRLLRREQPEGGWKTILDVGCGDGLFFPQLQQFGDVEGVEPVAEVLDPEGLFRRKIHVNPFDLSFQPKKKYSLILMLDVLEHLQDSVGALRHARSLLKPGGALLVTVPAFPALWTSHDQLNHHFVRYTKSSFRAAAQKAGLEIVEARYFFFWLFPAKLVARTKECLFGSKPTIPNVPSPRINRLLCQISRAEEKVLGGLPIPFGGSLMVWCRPALYVSNSSEENELATASIAL